MGAAFDDALITQVAIVISTEARAFNNANRTGLDVSISTTNVIVHPLSRHSFGLQISILSEIPGGDEDRRLPVKTPIICLRT